MIPSQLPLEQLKIIATKFAYLTGLRGFRNSVQPSALRLLDAEIERIATRCGYSTATLEQAVSKCPPELDAINSQIGDHALRIHGQLSAICQTCTTNTAYDICQHGSLRNDDTIRSRGLCIAAVKAIFHAVAEECAMLYGRVLGPTRSINTNCLLGSTHTHTKPHQLSDAPDITGLTEYPNDERSIAHVYLVLMPPNFSLSCIDCIPYILYHELLVHAFQDIYPDGYKRYGVDPHDSFSEGWMDYVAYRQCLHDMQRSRTLQQKCRGVVDFSQAFLVTNQLHASRLKANTPGDAYRNRGFAAANKLWSRFNHRGCAEPHSMLRDLSLVINAISDFAEMRRTLAELILCTLDDPSETPADALGGEVDDILSEYERDGSPIDTAKRFQQLFTRGEFCP